MESMKRVDVLKSIEQILVQKAYETGHVSHRSDGDWQKTNNGWVRVKGSPAQPAPDTDDSPERAEYERRLTEEQERRAEEDPTGYGYEEPPSSGEYGEITEEDLIETPKFDSDKEEQEALGTSPEDYDGYIGDDYEDDLMAQREALNNYHQSHPYPALDNEGHSKGLTSERDMFLDSVERFRELTDPDEEDQLTPSEALKQMKEEIEHGKSVDPDTFTPAIQSGHDKFVEWVSGFVGKSAVRNMKSTPATKNMGF